MISQNLTEATDETQRGGAATKEKATDETLIDTDERE